MPHRSSCLGFLNVVRPLFQWGCGASAADSRMKNVHYALRAQRPHETYGLAGNLARRIPFGAISILSVVIGTTPLFAAVDEYPPHRDSVVQPGVPKGELIKFEFAASKIFPGTTRAVTIYVPKQYDGSKPACVYVNQDGVQWNAPVVFDNLIARGDLPVIIGVFVSPGVMKAIDPATALDRFNRSYEYDGLGDGYARFLLEELLPAVEAKTTSDGRAIKLSKSGNDRAIGGSSSG